jgi:hypothetical protein
MRIAGLFAIGLLGMGAVSGCGDSPPQGTTCYIDYDCPTGTTCWSADGTQFECVSAGTGKAGDPCQAGATAPITCGDQLMCWAMGGPAVCYAWCDSKHPCPNDLYCLPVDTPSGLTLHFCV